MPTSEASLKFDPTPEPRQDSVLASIATEVEAMANRDGWGESLAFKVNLVLEELATNILSHGGMPGRRSPEIEIAIASLEDTLTIEVSDDGRRFDPLNDAPPAPMIDENTEAAPLGGMGLHLVSHMMDCITYRYEEGRNHLTLIASRG